MSLFHQSYGYTFKYPSLKLQTMASYHFTGGKHYYRNVRGTTDATPPNSAETRLLTYSACTNTQRSPAGELGHIQIRSLHITTRALQLLQLVPLVTHYS